MLNITTLALGAYQTNCYILHGEGTSCVVIDPGYEPARILSQTEKMGLTVEAILLTHGHFDHVGAVRDMAADTGCAVYIHEAELTMPPAFTNGPLYYTHNYGKGDVLALAGLTLTVMHTPGHTPGGVCLLVEDHLFCGDTLFAGSCGRTDLPGGSMATLMQSLTRLRELNDSITIHPGHGGSSTMAAEKSYNPYL